MSWSIRLKLKMLPVLDSSKIDAVILNRDINARLRGRRGSEDIKSKKAIKSFYSAASAEGYIDEMMRWWPDPADVRVWKRLGHCLVYLYAIPQQWQLGLPPTPFECIARTGESQWELYSFR